MRIEQSSGFMLDLLRRTQDGRMVPADFQRKYVWDRSDVEKFWHSLRHEWPTGTFLLWNPDPSVEYGRLGRGRIGPVRAFEGRPTLILDGQNRLATFAWSMRQPGDPLPDDLSESEAETWASGQVLVADGRDGTISFRSEADARDPHCFAPGLLVGPGANAVLRERMKGGEEFTDEEIEFLYGTVPDILREARCSLTVLENASVQEALDAFRHICRVGKPMTDEDYEDAMSWALPEAPTPR